MAQLKEIAVSSLLLDSRNPRLPEGTQGQPDLLRTMAEVQGDKLLTLAEDILDQGLNPSDLPLVVQSDIDQKRFIVLEGNRRVAALKMLEQPSLVESVFGRSRRLGQLGERFQQGPIRKISCVVVDERDEAAPWIERRHNGQQEGRGIVEWGATERARYAAQQGKTSPGFQVLEFVREHGKLGREAAENLRRVRLTNLDRLIRDTKVRDRLGLAVGEGGQVLTYYSKDQTLRALTRMVSDLAMRAINVTDLETQGDRLKYVNSFSAKELPDAGKRQKESRTLAGDVGQPKPGRKERKKKPKKDGPRKTLVPKNLALSVSDPRINNILDEMRSLSVVDFPNAAAVVLRAFLDMSVHDYIRRYSLLTDKEAREIPLEAKAKKVIEHLETNSKLNAQQAKAARKSTSNQTWLASGVKTMHEFVHNQYFHPAPSEMRTAWDNLEPLLVAIWIG